jgi:hypothetical protein
MRRPIGNHRFADAVCLVLATILFGCTILEARAGVPGAATRAQTGSEQKPTVKERILEIPPGTMVEVRLLNKQKLRGRLGEVTDEGFSLQTAQGNRIDTKKVAFSDLKSVKKAEGNKGKTAGWILLGALAGIGALVLIAVAAAASSE